MSDYYDDEIAADAGYAEAGPAPRPGKSEHVDHRLLTLPVRGAGQDLSGGHQGVDLTVTLQQPAGGAPLVGSAVQQLLGRDYERLECRVLAIDGPILCATTREQAEQAYNLGQGAAAVISGPFSWQPSGVERTRRNCDELWVALPGAAAATTHVSLIVSRRLAVEPPADT